MASIAPAGWSESGSEENKENKAPKKRLSLTRKRKSSSTSSEPSSSASEHRFEATSPRSLAKLAKYDPPKNTKVATNWAMRNFEEWRKWHNSNQDEACPEEVLSSTCSPSLLCWLRLHALLPYWLLAALLHFVLCCSFVLASTYV